MKKMTHMEQEDIKYRRFRIAITVVEIVLIAIAAVFLIFLYRGVGFAEEWDGHEEEYEIRSVICTKGDMVNVRPFPNTKNDPVGWLEPGEIVYLNGQRKNGFYYCVGINTEAGGGWVHGGYLVTEPPELINRTGVIASRSKVQARKNINGKRTRWLKPGGTVKVSYWTETWCVTDCGYVMSKFIELDGE